MRRNLIQEWPSVGAIARWLIGGSGYCLMAISLSHSPAVASSESVVNDAQNVTQVKLSATVNRPTLNVGSKGVEVSELQATLKLLGYYTDAVNGLYGQSSAIAVSKFQKAAGLQADGIVGPETWRSLFPAAPPTQPTSSSSSTSSPVASSVASTTSTTTKPTTSATASTNPKPANSPSPSNSSPVASSAASTTSSTTTSPTSSATTSTNPKAANSPSPSNSSPVASSVASTTSSTTTSPATSRTTSTSTSSKPANSSSPSKSSRVASSVASTATKPTNSRTSSTTNPKPANSPPKSVDLPILQLGMQGPAIARLQERLRTLGFFKGTVDSVFGPQTQAAVQAAQRNFKLNPDGRVGSTTWRYLLR